MVTSDVPSPWRTRRERQPERQAKRDALVLAAARLFTRQGFQGTSLDDIAHSLGVTKPTLYYYVANKEQILFDCVERGLATLREIGKPGFYEDLSRKTQSLIQGLQSAADQAGVPFCGDSEGGMFGFFLFKDLPQNYATVMTTDSKRFNTLFHGLLERGVYIAPALYEAGFMSAAHTDADIAETLAAAAEVFRLL